MHGRKIVSEKARTLCFNHGAPSCYVYIENDSNLSALKDNDDYY